MVDTQIRRKRLFNLLPALYAAQPETSVVRRLCDQLADQLSCFDADQQQVLRDRWWRLADGNRDDGQAMLEYLGHLLDLPRQHTPKHGWETDAAYRDRLQQTATVMREGLCTPVAMLGMAAAALDCDIRSTFANTPPTNAAHFRLQGDTTILSCRALRDEFRGQAQALWLTDTPLIRQQVDIPSLANEQELTLRNTGLLADVPELILSAGDQPVVYPSLMNVSRRELLIVAQIIQPNEQLVLRPSLAPLPNDGDPLQLDRFQTYDGLLTHPWARLAPHGDAVTGNVNITGRCHFVQLGSHFGEATARFAADQDDRFRCGFFATMHKIARTPTVGRGTEDWKIFGCTANDCRRFGINNVPAGTVGDQPQLGGARLQLRWWTRQANHVLMRIHHSAYVEQALDHGFNRLLHDYLERSRPAGVSFSVDYPRSLPREVHQHLVRTESRKVSLKVRTKGQAQERLRPQARLRPEPDSANPREPAAGWLSRFDITRFNQSRFVDMRTAVFDETRFDAAIFGDGSGNFNDARFDDTYFAAEEDTP